MSVFRAVLYAGCLAVGTWIGLGKPSTGDARAYVEQVKAKADAKARANADAKADANANANANAEAKAETATTSPELGPTTQIDPAQMPSMRPWPELNPDASIDKAWMVAEGPAYKARSGRRLVTLTFDDGPFPETTPTVLRILAKRKIRAAFFVIGRYLDGDEERAKASREVLKDVVAGGHLVGNHTHDHARLGSITHTQVLEQIDRGAESIERVTGRKPILFRPPFGQLDEFGSTAVKERGLDLVLWSVEKQDMQRADSHEVFRELVAQIEYKEGGIVLLHDIRWSSIHVLRELLDWLHVHRYDPKKPARLGYEIVDLPAYLREVAASPLPYATRDELEKVREAATHAAHPSRASRASAARRGSPVSRAVTPAVSLAVTHR